MEHSRISLRRSLVHQSNLSLVKRHRIDSLISITHNIDVTNVVKQEQLDLYFVEGLLFKEYVYRRIGTMAVLIEDLHKR